MKIYEAVTIVLNDSNVPLSVRDIYQAIRDRGLYDFKAKDPVSVVAKSIRSREVNKSEEVKAVFKKCSDGRYQVVSHESI